MIVKLDKTILGKVSTQPEMDEFVNSLNLSSDTVIVKPNWVEAAVGAHTDAQVLDLFLGSLKNKKIYILESYTFWRHQQFFESEKDAFSSKEGQLDTGKQHWDFYKQADKWFLEHTGTGEVLKKYNATYINVTNELWADKCSPVDLVPQIIYDLKGSDFISFAKLKGDADYGATLSIKNFFGLYPDPHRMKNYHGDDEEKLLNSILEVNKIYKQLFNCFYVVEGVNYASSFDWRNKENIKIFQDQHLIYGGSDAVQVDDTVLKAIGREFRGPLKNLLCDYQSQIGGSLQTSEIPSDYKIDFPKL